MQESKIVARGELPRQHVAFAMPCYDRRVAIECYQSGIMAEGRFNKPILDRLSEARDEMTVEQFKEELRKDNVFLITSSYRFVTGDQFIAKARNRLVTDVLTLPEFRTVTDIFFIDDDVGYPPEKVEEFLKRPEAIVGGVYPQKLDHPACPSGLETKDGGVLWRGRAIDGMNHEEAVTALKEITSNLRKREEPPAFPCTFELTEDGKFLQNADGFYSASLAPLGFMRVKRWVFEELAKGCRLYRDDNGDGTSGVRFNIFEAGYLPHWENWSGEDYDFCCKVRNLGEKIWIDTNIHFAHRGQKRWEGNLSTFMHVNADTVQQKIEDAQAQLEKEKAEAAAEIAA